MIGLVTSTITRQATYRACAICGKSRVGRGATRWPPDAEVCPTCSDMVRHANTIGSDRFSPPNIEPFGMSV